VEGRLIGSDGGIMAEIEKADLKSMDITEDKRLQLKQFFPEVFREKKIDFDHLKRVLGETVETGRERYGMNWAGKADCIKIIQQPSVGTLKPIREESINFDETENLFIEGDNLEVLKLLQKSYYGKIKMIYIDPPDTTGNDFIYPDNYTESLDTYLKYTGQVDSEGRKYSTNAESDGRFHSKWLNMMYPRLYLSRNLLRDDGVIFISIDDNELDNLKKLCDEIFGEENFVENIIWKKRYGGGAKEKHLVSLHEYILVYSKSIEALGELYIPLSEESIKRYYTDKDENFERRGPYRTHPLEATKSMGERKNLVFPIDAPDGTQIMPRRQWLWSTESVADARTKNELAFFKDKDGNWSVHSKQYLKNEGGTLRQGKAFSIIDDIFTQHGTNEIIELFDDAHVFPFPKPSKLLTPLLGLAAQITDAIVLDFFAGSGATAQAVLELNKQDKSNRRFILVQLPEPTGREDYSTIAEITKERIRRVIKKLDKVEEGKLA